MGIFHGYVSLPEGIFYCGWPQDMENQTLMVNHHGNHQTCFVRMVSEIYKYSYIYMCLFHIIGCFVVFGIVSSILSSYITKLLHSYGLRNAFERPMLITRQSQSCRWGFHGWNAQNLWNMKKHFHKELKTLEFGRISLCFFFFLGGNLGEVLLRKWQIHPFGFCCTGLIENRIVSWEGTCKDLTK